MHTSFDGRFDRINPSVVFGNPRVNGALAGAAHVRTSVRDLLAETISLTDYTIDGSATPPRSTLRGVQIDEARFQASLSGGIGQLRR